MTNEMIIMNERLRLMQEGIIQSTGNILEFTDEEGQTHQYEEPEEIHTFAFWKRAGRIVKHGSKAIATFPIWCASKGEKSNDETMDESDEKKKMFLKQSFFFTFGQTEELKK